MDTLSATGPIDDQRRRPALPHAAKDAETARFIALQKEQSSSLTPMDRLM